MSPDFDTMNETDVREIIVRPLLHQLGYRHGTQATIRTEVTLRYGKAFLGRKKPSKDPALIGRADYVCDAIPFGRWVVEVKPPNEPLSSEVREQTHTYAAHPEIAAAFFMITNGRQFELYRTSVLGEPVLAWNFEQTDEKLLTLFNLVSPRAIEKLANLVRADPGKPLARGVSSQLRIISGYVRYDEHVGTHAFLAKEISGLSLPVTGGYVRREDDGRILAHVDVASAAPMMRELNDVMGLGEGYEFSSVSECLSSDVEDPTIFQNFVDTSFSQGMMLPVPGMGRVPSPFGYQLAAYTEAVGFLDGAHFKGTMRLDYEMSFTGMQPYVRQMLEAQLGSFPEKGRMHGVGIFDIEFVDKH
jgi:hypothetical protein